MAVEDYKSYSKPDILNPALPSGSDDFKEGDNHIRMLKTVVKNFYAEYKAAGSGTGNTGDSGITVGTGPNEVPNNSMLGAAAYSDVGTFYDDDILNVAGARTLIQQEVNRVLAGQNLATKSYVDQAVAAVSGGGGTSQPVSIPTTYGAINTMVFAMVRSQETVNPGAIIHGSKLRPVSILYGKGSYMGDVTEAIFAEYVDTPLSGTWRAMGTAVYRLVGGVHHYGITSFIRIT